MSVKKRLFNLGNETVDLYRKIKDFSEKRLTKDNPLAEILLEIVEHANKIRMAVMLNEEKEKEEKNWNIKICCSAEAILRLKEKMDELDTEYILTPIKSFREELM